MVQFKVDVKTWISFVHVDFQLFACAASQTLEYFLVDEQLV